jgi:hypothetical protein
MINEMSGKMLMAIFGSVEDSERGYYSLAAQQVRVWSDDGLSISILQY